MNTIFVFAYEHYYPSGAMNDLIARVNNSAGDKTDARGLLRKDVLEQVLQQAGGKRNQYFEMVQVVHLDANGAIRHIERWREAPLDRAVVMDPKAPLADGQVRGHQVIFHADPYAPDPFEVLDIE